MANEIRLRNNNISGTITDNPLAIGATTINSAGFVDLPVVDATNHLILILDPLEVGGTAEIVKVTAHTAAATSVTVQRGQDGSVARSMVFNTTWFHGPVASDYNYTQRTALSTQRTAAPFIGELIYETDTNRWAAWNGSVWQPAPHTVPACRVSNSANISIPHVTQTLATYDTENMDTDNMHSTSVNTGRITFNTAGIYLVQFTSRFETAADWQFTYGALNANFGGIDEHVDGTVSFADAGPRIKLSAIQRFVVNDFVSVNVYQRNGAAAARNLSASSNLGIVFSAIWMSA